jgi:hypothetical protein
LWTLPISLSQFRESTRQRSIGGGKFTGESTKYIGSRCRQCDKRWSDECRGDKCWSDAILDGDGGHDCDLAAGGMRRASATAFILSGLGGAKKASCGIGDI